MLRQGLRLCPALLLLGCSSPGEPTGDPYVPGEYLGAYHVSGTLQVADCGTALGSPATWSFDVQLSRADYELFWLNGREAISGRVAADGVSFTIETKVDVPLEPDSPLGCTIARADRAAGRLSSATLDVPSFEGTLEYTYDAAPNADCSAYVDAAGFSRLPCRVGYALDGNRTRRPVD